MCYDDYLDSQLRHYYKQQEEAEDMYEDMLDDILYGVDIVALDELVKYLCNKYEWMSFADAKKEIINYIYDSL